MNRAVQIETIQTPHERTASVPAKKTHAIRYFSAPPREKTAPLKDEPRVVTARSFEEALKEAELSSCTELDFTYHVKLSSKEVKDLQARILFIKDQKAKKKPVNDDGKSVEECTAELLNLQARAIVIFQALKTNTRLESLRVDAKDLGEAAFCSLADSLETNRSLLTLDLSSNYITARATEMLGMALKWHCLQELHIDFNFMGNAGVDALCIALQGNTALRVLSLRGNNIGPEFPQSVLWLLTPRPLTASEIVYKGTELFESSLRTIHIDFNEICDLPIRLGNVAKLEVTASQNPITHPSPEVLATGWKNTWKVLREEWKEYEVWHAEQVALHNLQLQQNSTLPKWMNARGYDGVNADDL